MKRCRFLAAAGLGAAASALWLTTSSQGHRRSLPSKFILELDLEDTMLVENAQPMAIVEAQQIGQRRLRLWYVTAALQQASGDGRVRGLVGVLGPHERFEGKLAQVQELRSAILDFRRAAGQRAPTGAWAASFEGGTRAYLLASSFDRVWMQRSGTLHFTGFAYTKVFLRGLLDRWNVKPYFFAHKEFKSVVACFTEKRLSRPHRQAAEAILQSWVQQTAQDVAACRCMPLQQVHRLMQGLPLPAVDAMASGLIDGLCYRHQVPGLLLAGSSRQSSLPAADNTPHTEQAAGPPAVPAAAPPSEQIPVVSMQRYLEASGILPAWSSLLQLAHAAVTLVLNTSAQAAASTETASPSWLEASPCRAGKLASCLRTWMPGQHMVGAPQPKVAVVSVVGALVETGGSPVRVGMQQQQVASSALCRSLEQARQDPAVRAVVLRVDSPGGSAVAADSVFAAVLALRQAGKPVVVSMGDNAASGAYFISAPATAILAQPGTLTGSIGVAYGKIDLRGVLEGFGVSVDSCASSSNAHFSSSLHPYTAQQQWHIRSMLDAAYDLFVTEVATHRHLSLEQVHAAAKGRVWTGAQALQLGLVDGLGGLQDAVCLAREAAGLEPEVPTHACMSHDATSRDSPTPSCALQDDCRLVEWPAAASLPAFGFLCQHKHNMFRTALPQQSLQQQISIHGGGLAQNMTAELPDHTPHGLSCRPAVQACSADVFI